MVGGSNVAIHTASSSFLASLEGSGLSEFSEISEIFYLFGLQFVAVFLWALSGGVRWGG